MSKTEPPKLARWLLRRVVVLQNCQTILGDFEEIFRQLAYSDGRRRAAVWYWAQLLKSLPAFIQSLFYWSLLMLKNYVTIAFRSMWKQKLYSGINILGMSIALTCCTLIYLYVADELTFDRFHAKADRIYRVATAFVGHDDAQRRLPVLPAPMGPALVAYYPEIVQAVRFDDVRGVVRRGDRIFKEKITATDANIFDVFSFKLLRGNQQQALSNEDSVVLTEQVARKYFGAEDALGETLRMTFGQNQKEFTVTGVAENLPGNSTVRFDLLITTENLRIAERRDPLDNWDSFGTRTYIELDLSASKESVEGRFPAFVKQHFPESTEEAQLEEQEASVRFSLQNLKDIHFDPEVSGGSNPAGLFILIGIALMVLVIACINFVNLSIGRSSARYVEIGVRKVMGADRRQLIRQFWSESWIMVFLSMLLGLILTDLTLPGFNGLAQKNLALTQLLHFGNVASLLVLMMVVAFLAGSYPALLMSGFQPVAILKGKLKLTGGNRLSKSLVVIQFSLAVLLMISTLVMGRQIRHMITQNPGFVSEGIVVVEVQETDPQASARIASVLKDKLQRQSNVVSVAATSSSMAKPGRISFEEVDGKLVFVNEFRVDYDYVPTLDITLISGRNFSRSLATDSTGIIVNETLVAELGLESALGNRIRVFYEDYRVIGIAKDYNFGSFKREVRPAALLLKLNTPLSHLMVRIGPSNVTESLAGIEQAWRETQPDKPFVYSFLDDDLRAQYDSEKRWSAIVRFSSLFAILISCMGIFGLTSITIQRRIKEIGIRKVLGAKVSQILTMLLREFVVLVAVANLIAWPFAIYAMSRFLQDFHYRISLGPQYFLVVGALSVAVAVSTVFYLAVRAARSNPAMSVRYE